VGSLDDRPQVSYGALMAQQPGRHTFSTDRGRVVLLTARDGLAAQAGHDLTIEVGRWSAELTVADDGSPAGLSVRLDLNSLVVLEGTGGLKPLTDRDRREIAVTARKVIGVDRHPEATFVASSFEPGSNGGGFVQGTLTLGGAARPLRLHVASTGAERYHATASVRQSEFGIKPYTALLGALKVSDVVGVDVDVDLAQAVGAGQTSTGQDGGTKP
jgi:polyisoprenoid-binding protein YceI